MADRGDLPDELESRLSAELGERVVDTEVLSDGLNLVVAVATAANDWTYVLRRPNKLRDAALFSDLREEYRILKRLADTPVPTPEPVCYCEDESLLGEPFFLATHVDGESIRMESHLPARFRSPSARGALAETLVDTLADVHALPVERFADATEYFDPLDQVDSAVERLDHATDVTDREVPELWRVVEWLRANAPGESRRSLIHGDYKPGNVFFAETSAPEITGVLDWEAAKLADPRTELGYFLLYWRDAGDEYPPLGDLGDRYAASELTEVRRIADEGFYPFTTRPGSLGRPGLVDRYEERTGRSVGDLRFYRAHAALMLATVWEDLHRHAVEAGGDPEPSPLLDYFPRVARAVVDGDC